MKDLKPHTDNDLKHHTDNDSAQNSSSNRKIGAKIAASTTQPDSLVVQ